MSTFLKGKLSILEGQREEKCKFVSAILIGSLRKVNLDWNTELKPIVLS